jgi:signal transduction histidine kinase
LQGELTTINQELVKINSTLRGITQELLPPTLATYGLEGAIQSHVDGIRQANSEPNIELDFRQDGKSLDKNTRLALFRIYQNAITNVIRHAQAENVDIRFYKDDENYYLEVRDDGVGFEAPESWIDFARSGHLGLASTHERAQAIGGRMEIYSRPGKGTLVRVVVPGERGLGKPATGVREQ